MKRAHVGCLLTDPRMRHTEGPTHCSGDYCKMMLRASNWVSNALFHWQFLSADCRFIYFGGVKNDVKMKRLKWPFCPRFLHLLPLHLLSSSSVWKSCYWTLHMLATLDFKGRTANPSSWSSTKTVNYAKLVNSFSLSRTGSSAHAGTESIYFLCISFYLSHSYQLYENLFPVTVLNSWVHLKCDSNGNTLTVSENKTFPKMGSSNLLLQIENLHICTWLN